MLDYRRQKNSSFLARGFTLVELIVVITILGALLALSLAFIDPLSQLNKFNDAKRREDITQIKTALDTYYNDNSCFPDTLSFGSAWSDGGATYMKKVPQDPNCNQDDTSCYVYKAPGSCSQWSVVFAKLSKTPQSSACILDSMSNCTPQGYDSTWACTVTGNVDCAILSSTNIASSSGTVTVTPTPTPTVVLSTPTPTPTPTPLSCTPKNYACSGNPARCNVVPNGTGTYCNASCNGAC